METAKAVVTWLVIGGCVLYLAIDGAYRQGVHDALVEAQNEKSGRFTSTGFVWRNTNTASRIYTTRVRDFPMRIAP